MRVFLGIILGIVLTIAGAYLYDTSTGRAANGLVPSTAGGDPPMVNWGVVDERWHGVRTDLRNLGDDVQNGWRRLTQSKS